jgi:dienelactone hydrolase
VRYPSKDGTEITMFLIRNKDAKPDGKNPVLLYGYGGFNVSLTPGFSSSRAVWLEQGGMIAIPNLRGGGEYGEDWHKAGMGANKQNVFDDYIAAGRWLVAQNWTTPERLAIHGGSNGGLLVGAAMTQAPDLFRAVVCAVPREEEKHEADLDVIFRGAEIVDNSSPNGGLLVARVDPNSPAADRGLRPGDVITKVNRVPIRTLAEAVPIMEDARAILLEVQRNGRASLILMR